jgi:hypothetical protein
MILKNLKQNKRLQLQYYRVLASHLCFEGTRPTCFVSYNKSCLHRHHQLAWSWKFFWIEPMDSFCSFFKIKQQEKTQQICSTAARYYVRCWWLTSTGLIRSNVQPDVYRAIPSSTIYRHTVQTVWPYDDIPATMKTANCRSRTCMAGHVALASEGCRSPVWNADEMRWCCIIRCNHWSQDVDMISTT